MKARSIARELALLGVSQLSDALNNGGPHLLGEQAIDALITKALTTLGTDAKEVMDAAEGDLQRGERLILESETRTVDRDEVRSRIQPAVSLAEGAINKVGSTLELLVFSQQSHKKVIVGVKAGLEQAAGQLLEGDRLLAEQEQRAADISEARQAIQAAIAAVRAAIKDLKDALEPHKITKLINREEIRSYACRLLESWMTNWQRIDAQLDDAMEKWNIRRLARVDRDILRLAMIEILYMDVPKRVAIDEAIEMAKRYSDEDGYRFINGVLRRATDKLETVVASSDKGGAESA